MGRNNADDLLTPDEAVELLKGKITAQAIRFRIRKGALKCHHKEGLAGRVFVKRGELLALYHEKINGWGLKK
jgi:hypothetical protein